LGSRYKDPYNKLVQNHTERLLIAKIPEPFKEIAVGESSDGLIEIYFRLTLVATITNFVSK